MSIRVKYIGSTDRFCEVGITGQQQVWHSGESGYVSDANGVLLIASGLFVNADTTLPQPYVPTAISRTTRLKTLLQAAAFGASVMSTPPTFTTQAAYVVSGIAGAVFVSAASPSIYGHGSENWSVVTNAAINDGVNRNYYAPATPFAGSPFPIQCGFFFDGLQADFLFYGSPGQAWAAQFLIDGQLVNAAFPSNAGGGGNTRFIVSMTFATKKRRAISMTAAAPGWAGVFVAPTDTVEPMDVSSVLKLGFMGDSYLQAAGTIAPNGISQQVAVLLGTVFSTVDAVGGSGYVARNVGAGNGINNFLDRLTSNVQTYSTPAPDIHVTMGGINDASPLSQASVNAYFTALRAKFPNTILAAFGPWCPLGTNAPDASGSKYPLIRDVIKAGVAQAGGQWVFIDNLKNTWINSSGVTAASLDATTWQTGTGKAGALAGSGNNDIYMSSDGTHPNAAGIDYLSQRAAASIRAAVLALG